MNRRTNLTARRAADSPVLRYRDFVTIAEEHLRDALAGQKKMAKGEEAVAEGQRQRDAAVLAMSEAGMSGGQIARKLGMSETNVRNIVRVERLKRAAAG